jgi:hypothetical protein
VHGTSNEAFTVLLNGIDDGSDNHSGEYRQHQRCRFGSEE